ncbi:hypothetical protein ACVWW1_008482 [Bradyrhizobium sp. JR3.5]
MSTTNWFKMRDPTVIGIKTVLATQGDYHFEVEFHTPDSYQAKIANHDTYKELQKLQQQASGDALEQSEAEELARRAREVCKKVAIPPGARNIPHWGVESARRKQAGAAFTARVAEPGRREIGEIRTALGDRPIVLVGMPGAGKIHYRPASCETAAAELHRFRCRDQDRSRHVDKATLPDLWRAVF